jgi:hypothetical protein
MAQAYRWARRLLEEKVVTRRHLFDHGYPVASATLVAGSEILLAIGRCSLRKSTERLASSFLLLADSSGRLMSYAELHESRDNHVYIGSDRQPGEKAARHQPQDRPARPHPHHR